MSVERDTSAVTEAPTGIGLRPWIVVGAAIGGLLLLIAIAGIVALEGNEEVRSVTERSLLYDLEVEDEGDDLRVAVLDMRHYHRNILFGGASVTAIEDFDRAFANLREEIGELEQLRIAGPGVPQPAQIRALAETYYAEFRPAIAAHDDDPAAFRAASDVGLRRLQELDDAAEVIDHLGEELTEASLTRVDDVATWARTTLIGLVGGVVLVGLVLAVACWRILRQLHASYGREQAIAQALARSLRTKNDFISDASHELRTPLTLIRGNAEIGLNATEPAIQREVLDEIWAEATRMTKLVDDLLFLARSDAGLPPLERELVPAHWLAKRLVRPAEVLARQHSSCLAVQVGGDGYLTVDPSRIEQAVLILVDNAAKHAPPDTCVELSSRVARGELIIEVADRGEGIPPEELDLIFDRFYQVGNRRTRKQHGAGLGLSIAKTIVEAHGGRILADSAIGVGTRMTIVLPLCDPAVVLADHQQSLTVSA